MFAMLLILMIAVGNFALGFFLAVHFGYGPTGLKVAAMEIVRTRFRGTAQSGGPQPH
jgi:hypothetical protein